MSSDLPDWRVECAGGCGRYMTTHRPTVLWNPPTCPVCQEVPDEQ